MENAILSAGIKELKTVRNHVRELDKYKLQHEKLLKEEEEIGKALKDNESLREKEIAKAVQKKKADIAGIYDSLEESYKRSLKEEANKRERYKKKKIEERVQRETRTIHDIKKSVLKECRTILKQANMPYICRTKPFLSLFCPGTVSDYVMAVLIVAVLTVIVPAITAAITAAAGAPWYGVLIAVAICEALVVTTYMITDVVFHRRYPKEMETAKKLRKSVFQLSRSIRKLESDIKKDPDESLYGLTHFDTKMENIAIQLKKVGDDREEAFQTFDKSIKKTVQEDVKKQFDEEIEETKKRYKKVAAEEKRLGIKIDSFSFTLSRQYGAYIGKENLSVPKLDKMIRHIEKGEAANIGEAIAIENKNEKIRL